jgi:DNA-binding MarR family transcriptional regulator
MADDLGTILQVAAQAWREEFRREMAARGFAAHASASGEVLLHVPQQGVSQTVLTASMGLSKQAVQQLLDQLEGAQYLRREPDPQDKRAKRVTHTDFGLRELAERSRVIAEIEERYRDKLGKKLLGKLEKALRRLAKD